MTKVIILFCAFCFFVACNQKAEMPQEKTPLLQGSTMHTEKNRQIRMEKVSEIHLKEREEAYIGEIFKNNS